MLPGESESSGTRPSSVRTIVTCFCIIANAITAGGIFCFPLFAPSLAEKLQLSQSQLSTIALAGMIGQYPFAAAWGMFVDRIGPWACSLSASVLFSLAFGSFSWTIRSARETHEFTLTSYYLLVFYFFVAGLGTVASYFSCLFSAPKVFPNHVGLATGIVTSVFGLSPLFLSLLASLFFTEADGGVHAPQYLCFLAILTGIVNLVGSLGLKSVPRDHILDIPSEEGSPYESDDDETSTLLPPRLPSTTLHEDHTILTLFREPEFWGMAFVMLVGMGSAEMVISNIGTIVQSLAPRVALHSLSTSSVSTQVRLISISNTASRLISGTLADRVSPPPHHLPTGYIVFFRKRYVSRVVFVFTACTLLFVSFFWMATAVQTQRGVWVLSVGTGASYGMMWTIVPGLVSSMWGARNAARNFGAISYAPFVGTPLFTYLYAYISDRGRGVGDGGAICEGTHCWRDTFVVCAGAACLATLTSVGLWRKFKSQL